MSSESKPAALSQRAAQGAFALTVFNGAAAFLVVGLTTVLNHVLADPRTEIGVWQLLLLLFGLSSTIFEGGLATALKQAKELTPPLTRTLVRIQLLFNGLGIALVFIFAPFLTSLVTDEPLTELLRLSAVGLLFVAFGQPQKALLERDLHFPTVARIEAGCTTLFVVAGLPLGILHGAEGLLWATLLRHAVETVFYWRLGPLRMADLVATGTFDGAGTPLRTAAGMWGQVVVSQWRLVDRLLVSKVLGAATLAFYGLVQTILALPLARLTMYIMRVALPAFSRVQDSPERLNRGLEQLLGLLALTLFPIMAGLCSVSPRLFFLLWGPEYDDVLALASQVTVVLCVGAAAMVFTNPLGIALNAKGKSTLLLVIQTTTAVVMIISLLLSAGRGVLMVAGVRSLGLSLMSLVLVVLARRHLGFSVRRSWRAAWRALAVAVAMGVAVALAGRAAGQAWPACAPLLGHDEARATAVTLVLGGQVLLGVGLYALGVKLLRVPIPPVLFDLLARLRARLTRSDARVDSAT
ncbi:MAG: oligosaccharide flippase family protein [Acidobacteriota bacterium]